jgi:hypothetical protein
MSNLDEGDLFLLIAQAIVDAGRRYDRPGPRNAVECRAAAKAVIAAGWRPPPAIPDDTGAPDDPTRIIDRIRPVLLAHGWRAPAQTITTLGELSGLPIGTVILSKQGGIWVVASSCLIASSCRSDHCRTWYEPGALRAVSSQQISLPATVIWGPG